MQVRVNIRLLPDYQGEEEATQRVVEGLVKVGFMLERVTVDTRTVTGVIDFGTIDDIRRVAGLERIDIDRIAT
jgi:hypothetical protein